MMMRILKFAVSAAVLGLLIWWVDAARVAERLKNANIAWLLAALLSLTVLTFLMARRWQMVASRLELEISYPRAVAEYYIAQMINLVLPGGVLGDVGRAVRVRHEGDLRRAALSVAAERVVGQATMFLIMGFAFAVALTIPGGIAWPMIAWAGIAGLLVAMVVSIVIARGESKTARFFDFALRLMKDGRLLIYALTIAVLLIFSVIACARATGTVVPVAGWFTLIPLVLSSMLIPLSVGGWGWREGAAAALFPMIGASPDAGVAMGIAYGAMMIIAALPALYFMMQTRRAHPEQPDQRMDNS